MDSAFIELLRRQLKLDPAVEITADSSLRDLGMDSMRSIELLFAVEDTYDITLPDDELNDTTFGTPGNLWRAVHAQLPGEPVTS
ncbi:acyl carrier protein [Streptomyces sp. SID14515]|uniref:phosphopantetheine-binding protein n=1 Tax=Streptomyces sp. SID14515 TaxID=2706074 RepID=UPI0013C8227D|nr:acyl carrier protein [Streptomyces sp. SID14515]